MPHNVAPPHTVSTFVRARHVAWVFVCVLFVSGVCVCVSESRSGQVAGRAQLKEPVYLTLSLSLSVSLVQLLWYLSIGRRSLYTVARIRHFSLSLSLYSVLSLSHSLASTQLQLSSQCNLEVEPSKTREQSRATPPSDVTSRCVVSNRNISTAIVWRVKTKDIIVVSLFLWEKKTKTIRNCVWKVWHAAKSLREDSIVLQQPVDSNPTTTTS